MLIFKDTEALCKSSNTVDSKSQTQSEQTEQSASAYVSTRVATKAISAEDRFKAQMVWRGVCSLQANCLHAHTHTHRWERVGETIW